MERLQAEFTENSEYIDVRGDGRIVLYVRHNRWTTRLKIPGNKGYVVKATKTNDLFEARRVAEDLFYELEGRARRGESVNAPSFTRVAKEWASEYPILMKDRTETYITGNIRKVENHLNPFFGKLKITQINDRKVEEYYIQRQSQGKQFSNVTLRHEATVLTSVFQFAKRKGYIASVPDIPRPKNKVSPRPDIPQKEYQTLYRYLRQYVKNAQDKRRYRERLYLQNWILILANTGLRVGELRNVRWDDISSVTGEDGADLLAFFVSGKTGERHAIAMKNTSTYLYRLWEHRTEELGKEPPLNEFVICSRDGDPVVSFKKGFKRALEECGILYDNLGRKRVPYSLRHTYATMRIGQGVNIYQLASNMGTSVDMIEMYYGKKRNTDPRNVSEITKYRALSKRQTKQGKNSHPWN